MYKKRFTPDDLEKEVAICSGCGAMESVERWQKRVAPRLSFICANCGSPQETDCDSIDNGTDLQCQECGKHSVVNLFREDEYSMICEAIKAAITQRKNVKYLNI